MKDDVKFIELTANWAEAVSSFISAITLITIVFAFLQIKSSNKQMHREFESMYIGRFWEIIDEFSDSFIFQNIPENSDKRVAYKYLSLSNEQVGLKAHGRITDETWEYWSKDIKNFCENPFIEQMLIEHNNSFPYVWELSQNSLPYSPKKIDY